MWGFRYERGHMKLVLFSGGMDSALLLCALAASGEDVRAMAFDYSQHHGGKELLAARLISKLLGVQLSMVCLPNIVRDGEPGAVVPARNMMFASYAANVVHREGGGDIYFGFCREDAEGFADCRPDFIEALNSLFVTSGLDVCAHAPFIYMTKAEIMDRCVDLKHAEEVFFHSYSCYRGTQPPCGECDACRKREAACL